MAPQERWTESEGVRHAEAEEHRLKFALDMIRAGEWDLDLIDHTSHRSLLHDQIFGYKTLLQEWTYKKFLEHVMPEDRARVDQAFHEAIENRHNWSFECRIIRSDNVMRWIWAVGQISVDSHGRPARMRGVVQDITDRKKIEMESKAESQKIQAVLENIEEGVIIFDHVGKLLSMNRAARELYGYSNVEEIRRPFSEFQDTFEVFDLADRHVPVEEWPIPRVLRGEKVSNMKLRIRRKDTGKEWIGAYSGTLAQNSGGGEMVPGVIIVRNITEQQQIEGAVERSEERFRTMFAQAPLGIALIDSKTGAISEVNSRFAEIAGRTIEQMREIDWMSITHPDDVQEDLDNMALLNAGKISGFHMNKRYLRPDGSAVWISMTIAPLKVEDSAHPRHLCMIEDITERRCAELTLAEGARRKDEFIAMLSHELRNPLSAIRQAVQVANESPESLEAYRWSNEVIDRQSAQLARMVEDLLDVARINQGRVKLRLETLDLGSVLGRAVSVIRPLIEQRHQSLAIEIADQLFVSGDPLRLEQVFVNLLNNSAKYTPEGGDIRLRAWKDSGEAVVLITDNGVGISADLLPHVFELFRQADQTLERAQGGLGIGLSIVKKLVEMQSGRVTVESAGANAGTSVTVRLPLLLNVRSTAGDRSLKEKPEPLPTAIRVLVVDDHKDAANTLSRLLQRRGCEVRQAYSGPDGLALAREFRPEVLLLDIGLPGFDGYELARRLRADPGFSNALMIAITGYAQDIEREHCLVAGFDDHYAKPLDFSKLMEAIQSHCLHI